MQILPLLCVAGALASLASPGEPPARPHAERVAGLAGLQHVGRVTPSIFRGAAPTEEGLRTLKARGVKTVINLRHYHGASEEKACRAVGLDYVRIAFSSSRTPRDADVRRFLEVVTDPARQPVYFHCWRGKDRTGAMAAVYRIAVEGWTVDEALAEMDAYGFFKGYDALRRYVRRVGKDPSRVWSGPPPGSGALAP